MMTNESFDPMWEARVAIEEFLKRERRIYTNEEKDRMSPFEYEMYLEDQREWRAAKSQQAWLSDPDSPFSKMMVQIGEKMTQYVDDSPYLTPDEERYLQEAFRKLMMPKKGI
jgi:hypothetical protein